MELKTVFPIEFYSEECREIRVHADTKRLWAVLLDLLIEFNRVCKKHGIKYMIDGGTLLGAARNGGFIPWDDDIDVIMLRGEYEKLNKIASQEFSSPYFWQTFRTDHDHGRGFARLRNSSTTYIPKFEMIEGKPSYAHNQGVFIDVFICDNVPDDTEERSQFLDCLSRFQKKAWQDRVQKVQRWSLGCVLRLPELLRKLRYEFLHTIGADSITKNLEKLDRMAQCYSLKETHLVSHLTFCPVKESRQCILFPRYVLEELGEIEFEGYMFPATKHIDEYLKIVYGDWRKNVVGSNTTGGFFIDLENSYVKYLS